MVITLPVAEWASSRSRLVGGQLEDVALQGEAADEDGRGAPGEALGDEPGLLQRLPGHLQEQALLRVEAGRLAGGHAEEAGVEGVQGLGEEARPSG